MSQVETVATWAGLLTGISGVVLSVVAIWFAISTERRSANVSDHTIQSLQKIESQVDRASKDTQDLIKVAWDRLVTKATGEDHVNDASSSENRLSINQVVSGLVAELKSQGVIPIEERVEERNSGSQEQSSRVHNELPEVTERIEQLLVRVEEAISNQVQSGAFARNPSEAIDSMIKTLGQLAPEEFELVRALAVRGRHLTSQQYRELIRNPAVGPALGALRERGLIVPLSGHNGKEELVYWFTPATSDYIRSAIRLARSRTSLQALTTVRDSLTAVGYLPSRSTSTDSDPQELPPTNRDKNS